MRSRLELQTILEDILESKNVYFQPPESVKIKYPCIIYERSNEDVDYADNIPYHRYRLYSVTVIDRDPDSEIPDRIAELETAAFDRWYTSNNLNHYTYRLYF